MLVETYMEGYSEESLQESPGGRTARPDPGYCSAAGLGGRTARSDLHAQYYLVTL